MDRILRDTQSTIKLQLQNAAEEATNADTGPVSAAITDSAGIAVTGSPFIAPHPPTDTGNYEVVLSPTVTAILDVYDALWSAAVGGAAQKFRSSFEVVGGFIVSLSEIRAVDDKLQDTAKWTREKVATAREHAEDLFEEQCGVAFRPKGRRFVFDGTGRADVLLPDLYPTRIVAGSIDGVALTSTQLADLRVHPSGVLVRDTLGYWTRGDRNNSILYEYGMKEAPQDVKWACARLAVHYLMSSPMPDRAISQSTDTGTVRYATAGKDGPTGLPEVDAVIERWSSNIPGVG